MSFVYPSCPSVMVKDMFSARFWSILNLWLLYQRLGLKLADFSVFVQVPPLLLSTFNLACDWLVVDTVASLHQSEPLEQSLADSSDCF